MNSSVGPSESAQAVQELNDGWRQYVSYVDALKMWSVCYLRCGEDDESDCLEHEGSDIGIEQGSARVVGCPLPSRPSGLNTWLRDFSVKIPRCRIVYEELPYRRLEAISIRKVGPVFWHKVDLEDLFGAIRIAHDALEGQCRVISELKKGVWGGEECSDLPTPSMMNHRHRLSSAITACLFQSGGSDSEARLSVILESFVHSSLESWDDQISSAWKCLNELSLLGPHREIIIRCMFHHVHAKVQEVSSETTYGDGAGQTGGGTLGDLLPWMEDLISIRPLLCEAVGGRDFCMSLVSEAVRSIRSEQFFDMVTDFPDSIPALQDLGRCPRLGELASHFKSTLEKRVLHPGASTSQIIDVYIATVKALRVVDPEEALLDEVAAPMRSYLRERSDTIRCIVSALTDEGSGVLYEELRRQGAKPVQQIVESDDDEADGADSWQPARRDEHLRKDGAVAFKSADILSLLVSIYGSKELFVTEYRVMLADKLLSSFDFSTDKERQTLELLKVRFGEDSMKPCDVMIRDVDESKCISDHVQDLLKNPENILKNERGGGMSSTVKLDAIMISSEYWPPLNMEEAKWHPSMTVLSEEFQEAYAKSQTTRKLEFRPQLGNVDLEICFQTGIIREYSVSPIHATLILHFQDSPTWTLTELALITRTAADAVRRRMAYWISCGVVSQQEVNARGGGTDLIYVLQDDQEDGSTVQQNAIFAGVAAPVVDDDDLGEIGVSIEAQGAYRDGVIEQYITGMLSNMGKLSIGRIHNLLKIFMSSGGGEPSYDKTLSGLSTLLTAMRDSGKLEFIDGTYSLAH